MEPPTPKQEKKAEQSFMIISDKNHSFLIKLTKFNSSIEIIGTFKDELLNHIYKIELSLDELKKSNKYFLLYETIDEIYEDLNLLMNKKQTKIYEDNNSIRICIPIESLKIKEILITLNELKKRIKK